MKISKRETFLARLSALLSEYAAVIKPSSEEEGMIEIEMDGSLALFGQWVDGASHKDPAAAPTPHVIIEVIGGCVYPMVHDVYRDSISIAISDHDGCDDTNPPIPIPEEYKPARLFCP